MKKHNKGFREELRKDVDIDLLPRCHECGIAYVRPDNRRRTYCSQVCQLRREKRVSLERKRAK